MKTIINPNPATTWAICASLALSLWGCSGSNAGTSAERQPAATLTPDMVQTQNVGNTFTKILSINGEYTANHGRNLTVNPGDVVTLSADVVDSTTLQATYAPVEQFQWFANDRTGDACDASQDVDCLTTSNFQVNNYGVSFYVPFDMQQQIIITVRNKLGSFDMDSLVLLNAKHNTGYQAPSTPITSATEYNQSSLDPDYALAGQGRWVTINGTRFFVPYTYVHDNDADWTPYRNGYWSRDQYSDELVWISYDPWGWMTDHYGVWRHHGVYGWIWSPFTGRDFYYRNHCVTFYYHDNYVGWYPYYSNYSYGYSNGYNHGFNDGFWAGYAAASGYGSYGYNYYSGYTMVSFNFFTSVNIVNVYHPVYINGVYNPIYGGVLGHAVTRGQFNSAMDARVRGQLGSIPGTSIVRGTATYANPIHTPDPRYGQVVAGRGAGAGGRTLPVGTQIDVRSGSQGQGRVIQPSVNGRGIANAPVGRDASGNTVELPSQTSRPTQANPDSRGSGRANPAPTQPGQTPNRPVLNPAPGRTDPMPGQNRPTNPAPAPSRPSNPSPAPAPGRNDPIPAPSRPSNPAPAPAPGRNDPIPAPSRPSNPAPAPSRPSNPAPAPSRPSNPAPAPSRPSNPAPAPSRPSNPGPSTRPAPAPSRPSNPSPAPSRPSNPSPSRPAPRGR